MAQSGRDGNDGLMVSDCSLPSFHHHHSILALVLPTRAPAMESLRNLAVNPSGTQSLHHDVAEHPSFPFLSTDLDSNDFSNVPPSRETSLPSQSLISTNSYLPSHDHTSTHVPPSPENSLRSQSLVCINSYAPTHDHLSHPNHSAPTPNGQLQTGTVPPRQNTMYLDVPPVFTHDPGESIETAVITARRRDLLLLREMLQHHPQFFLSMDCRAAPDTHYADTDLPSSAPSAHYEAEHAVRSVTTEYDTGRTQSTNDALGSGASLHYPAGLADAAEAAPPTIPLQSFPSSSASHPTIAYRGLGGHNEPVYNLPNTDMCLPPSAYCGPGHERQLFATEYQTDPSPSTTYGAPVSSARSDPYRRKGPGQYRAVSAGAAPFSSVPPPSSIAHLTTTRSLLGGRSAAPDASYAGMNLPPSDPSAFYEPGHAVQSAATVLDSCPSPSTPPGAFCFPSTPPAEPGHHPAVSAGAAPMASGDRAIRQEGTSPPIL
ncbi:hypothetical protein B0H13DRAFT_2664698 [Mycena leptocephala]|nr:hypothetical protein B0H13DRAFT_2664698 [Mycena leptocephala]